METNEIVAGLDEVGMGCLAGPLVVCVALFSKNHPPLSGVDDSKKLSPKKREGLVLAIREAALCYGFGWACPAMIDSKGISYSWQWAANEALSFTADKVDVGAKSTLIIDGIRKPTDVLFFQNVILEPKADANYWQVSAASILAKVMRDSYMKEVGKECPDYRWDENSGYGTDSHLQAIRTFGPTRHHRLTFLKKI